LTFRLLTLCYKRTRLFIAYNKVIKIGRGDVRAKDSW